MARTRLIKPRFFRSIALFLAEIAVNKENRGPYMNLRVAFAGIFTVADREGRFEWRPEELKLDCLPYDPVDFEAILDVLAASTAGHAPFIHKYEVGGKAYGWVPGIRRHQKCHWREPESQLPPPPNDDLALQPIRPGPPKKLAAERAGRDAPSLTPSKGDTPAQSLVWHLASLQKLEFKNGAEVGQFFGAQIKAANEVMRLAGGELEIARTATSDIWKWLSAKAATGEISAPRNLQAVVNNFIQWRQEWDAAKAGGAHANPE